MPTNANTLTQDERDERIPRPKGETFAKAAKAAKKTAKAATKPKPTKPEATPIASRKLDESKRVRKGTSLRIRLTATLDENVDADALKARLAEALGCADLLQDVRVTRVREAIATDGSVA